MNGSELAAALSNPRVDTALLPVDVVFTNSDWPPDATIPIVIRRNFTIQGIKTSRLVTLDLGYMRHKVGGCGDVRLQYGEEALSMLP